MTLSNQQTRKFYSGVDSFNANDYEQAHADWEQLWKDLRLEGDRDWLKCFLQLSGSVLNLRQGKTKAARYLLERAVQNLIKYKQDIEELIEPITLREYLNILLKNRLYLKVFNDVYIKRSG